MRRILALLICIGVGLALLAPSTAAASAHADFVVSGVVKETLPLGEDGTLTLPAAPAMGTLTFVGWVLEEEDSETLYPAGYVFRNETGKTALTFRAFGVELQTLTGAAVSYTENKLRFDGAVSLVDAERLASLARSVTYGVLTAPVTEISGAADFRRECGAAHLTDSFGTEFAVESTKQGMFFGYTAAIADAALTLRYAGRAYITVHYGTGTEQTFYAPFYLTDHARSVHAVSAMAFEDRREESGIRYVNVTETAIGTLYSPYTATVLTALSARFDRVVSVDDVYDDGGVLTGGILTNTFTANAVITYTFRFYTSPYTVSGFSKDTAAGTATFCITGVNGADFHNITCYYIGGSYRAPAGDECRADGYYITERTRTSGG